MVAAATQGSRFAVGDRVAASQESVRNHGRLTGRLLCRTSFALEGTRDAPQKLPLQAHRKPPPDPRHQFERVGYLRSCWCAIVCDAPPLARHPAVRFFPATPLPSL